MMGATRDDDGPADGVDILKLEKHVAALHSDLGSVRQTVAWAALGRELLNAISGCEELRIFRRGGRSYIYSVQAIPGKIAEREALQAALASINNNEPTKECNSCGIAKTLESFSNDRNSKDGKVKNCKLCERGRVAEYEQRTQRKANRRLQMRRAA